MYIWAIVLEKMVGQCRLLVCIPLLLSSSSYSENRNGRIILIMHFSVMHYFITK
jgi:hypothetical protein